jgi:hypothetical protein
LKKNAALTRTSFAASDWLQLTNTESKGNFYLPAGKMKNGCKEVRSQLAAIAGMHKIVALKT